MVWYIPLVTCLLDRVVEKHCGIVTVFFRNLERILEHPTVNMERLCTATHPRSWVLCILDSCSRSATSKHFFGRCTVKNKLLCKMKMYFSFNFFYSKYCCNKESQGIKSEIFKI